MYTHSNGNYYPMLISMMHDYNLALLLHILYIFHLHTMGVYNHIRMLHILHSHIYVSLFQIVHLHKMYTHSNGNYYPMLISMMHDYNLALLLHILYIFHLHMMGVCNHIHMLRTPHLHIYVLLFQIVLLRKIHTHSNGNCYSMLISMMHGYNLALLLHILYIFHLHMMGVCNHIHMLRTPHLHIYVLLFQIVLLRKIHTHSNGNCYSMLISMMHGYNLAELLHNLYKFHLQMCELLAL